MRTLWLGLLCLQFIPLGSGYTTSSTTCTISPPNSTNFVSTPDTRGTLSILWSCLFTVFACTWAILHLNIPEQRGTRNPGFLGDVKWRLKDFWTNFKWMIFTILAPELILGKALCDLATARTLFRQVKEIADKDKVPWSLTHSYYVCMGGFAVRAPENIYLMDTALDTVPERTPESSNEVQLRFSHETETVGDIEQVNQVKPEATASSREVTGLVQSTETSRPAELIQYDICFHMNNYSFKCWLFGETNDKSRITTLAKVAASTRARKRLPYITEEEINEKSQSNVFTKVIATAQVFWIAVEVIARRARGLSISQLELAATAFSACAVITYIINIKKPQGIQTPTTILCYTTAPPPGHLRAMARRLTGYSFLSNFFDIPYFVNLTPTTNIENDDMDSSEASWFVAGLAIGGLIIGGIHLAAWNFVFPTRVDQILWRSASIFSTAVIPITSSIMWAESRLNSNNLLNAFNIVLTSLYIIARLILLVEIFRTLFFLPPDAYIATWASNIPYVG